MTDLIAGSAQLTVAENSIATAIGIPEPVDVNYASAALTITVTALPSDGVILLADGLTPVTLGEPLSVQQLTGLKFRPALNNFGESSEFAFTVSDPAGNTASATATLTTGPSNTPLIAHWASLYVPQYAQATAIGISAPTDINFPAQLTVKLTETPTNGTVFFSDGTTRVAVGQTLTVAQLTGLVFVPSATGSASVVSNLAYSVSDPGGHSTNATVLLEVTPPPTGGSAATGSNPIVLENEKPGTPQSVWQVDPGEDFTLIQGFTTSISTNIGGTVDFKINNQTGNGNYQINIYRLGYYGGDGARLVGTIDHQSSNPIVQPAPLTDPAAGIVDAGNWQITDYWNLPADAISGVYVANIVSGSQVFQIPFVVKNESSTSDIVFQTDDETWQAYNGWGGASVYTGDGPAPTGAAYAVSYNRPITTRDGTDPAFSPNGSQNEAGPQDTVFGAEYSAIYWLEQNGYDVSYIAGLDTATNGSLLLAHKIFMDAGHDEYWTDNQVANVQAAANAGVNLAFLSGNEIFWQTRFEPSIDGSGTANRTLVTYKDSHFGTVIDPNGTGTGTFEAPPNMGGAAMPSNTLTGTVFQVDANPVEPITIPYGETLLRFWRNTSVANTAPGQTATLAPYLLGYEWDSSPDNGFRPVGLVNLSATTLFEPTAYNTAFGNVDTSGTVTHNLVEYRDPTSGALVFGAGTVFWSWGLADQADSTAYGAPSAPDPNVQQAMVNLFADMGVQPSTLQASLVIASQSTDHTPPTSMISSLSTSTPIEGQLVTVTGTANDAGGGVIARVDVSTDGGKTWHPATSSVGAVSESWTYTFAAPTPGTYTIKSLAVDDSLNLETPGPGISYTVSPSTALTLFNTSATPAIANVSDPDAVEVGLKFASTTSGEITGIRFYKGPLNTGTHVVDLWSSTGTLLATAPSTNETASGWQQVNFSSPVKITAGTTYIASYHSGSGEYSDTPYYFDTLQPSTNGSLTATGNGLNGVFAYSSSSIFPTYVSSSGDNYWVDVVFKDGIYDPQATDDSGFVATENIPLPIAASALLANDTDPNGLPLSITGVSNPIDGTVSYDPGSQTVTFVPTTAGTASFTYSVTDGSGTASANVSITVNNPATAQTLFSASDTPAIVTVSDHVSVELGVKFQASVDGTITGIRFYKGPENTGTHVADLWTADGTLLATATFTNESASGWQQVNFSDPVSITAGTTYVTSYHTSGDYSADNDYFTTAHTNESLTALASSTSGGDGLYAYGSGTLFPTNTYNAANYWVDVVFEPSPALANNDSGFVATENIPLPIAASALLANDTDSNGLPLSITGVSNPIDGTVSYDPGSQTVTFVPTTAGTASFTYSVTDGSGTASANVSITVNNPATAQTLFLASDTPAIVTLSDPNSVELGVKFQASVDGTITGIRFYKGPENTGTHVADLWTADGTLLAAATFTNESASGWQQVNFSDPVSITAGTTYVASYHTSGDYSADSDYFTAAHTNGSLTALASSTTGGDGLYAYGTGTLFPTNTYNAANYWVDVVFEKSLLQPPVANNDSGFVATENIPLPIAASALLANDTDSNGLPLSITGVSNPIDGTVSYDPGSQTVTFVPTTAGTASLTYSVTDGSGTASANVSITVNNPASAQTLFSASDTPSIVTVNDPSSVELGVKFQASETDGKSPGFDSTKDRRTTARILRICGPRMVPCLPPRPLPTKRDGWQQVNFTTRCI